MHVFCKISSASTSPEYQVIRCQRIILLFDLYDFRGLLGLFGAPFIHAIRDHLVTVPHKLTYLILHNFRIVLSIDDSRHTLEGFLALIDITLVTFQVDLDAFGTKVNAESFRFVEKLGQCRNGVGIEMHLSRDLAGLLGLLKLLLRS